MMVTPGTPGIAPADRERDRSDRQPPSPGSRQGVAAGRLSLSVAGRDGSSGAACPKSGRRAAAEPLTASANMAATQENRAVRGCETFMV